MYNYIFKCQHFDFENYNIYYEICKCDNLCCLGYNIETLVLNNIIIYFKNLFYKNKYKN